jgi:hypothetical protein
MSGYVFVTNTNDSLYLRIDEDTDIPGSAEPDWRQDVTGICIQDDGSNPYSSGYMLMPRSLSDFSAAMPTGTPETNGIPRVYSLAQNYPNPFNPITTIRYALPKACKARLDVYNVLGQRVVTLVDEWQDPGRKIVRWNGTNANGNHVASGVYFYRLRAGNFVKARKMVLLR